MAISLTLKAVGSGQDKYLVVDEDEPALIGRASVTAQEVPLPDNGLVASGVMSRRHAHFFQAADGELMIVDLASTHGTTVTRRGGQLVHVPSSGDGEGGIALREGDLITFGRPVERSIDDQESSLFETISPMSYTVAIGRLETETMIDHFYGVEDAFFERIQAERLVARPGRWEVDTYLTEPEDEEEEDEIEDDNEHDMPTLMPSQHSSDMDSSSDDDAFNAYRKAAGVGIDRPKEAMQMERTYTDLSVDLSDQAYTPAPSPRFTRRPSPYATPLETRPSLRRTSSPSPYRTSSPSAYALQHGSGTQDGREAETTLSITRHNSSAPLASPAELVALPASAQSSRAPSVEVKMRSLDGLGGPHSSPFFSRCSVGMQEPTTMAVDVGISMARPVTPELGPRAVDVPSPSSLLDIDDIESEPECPSLISFESNRQVSPSRADTVDQGAVDVNQINHSVTTDLALPLDRSATDGANKVLHVEQTNLGKRVREDDSSAPIVAADSTVASRPIKRLRRTVELGAAATLGGLVGAVATVYGLAYYGGDI